MSLKYQPAPVMSRTKAIHMMCKSCTYDSAVSGTWREQVENCRSQHCPLWQHRPVTSATIASNRKNNNNSINIDALVAGLEDEEADYEVLS